MYMPPLTWSEGRTCEPQKCCCRQEPDHTADPKELSGAWGLITLGPQGCLPWCCCREEPEDIAGTKVLCGVWGLTTLGPCRRRMWDDATQELLFLVGRKLVPVKL